VLSVVTHNLNMLVFLIKIYMWFILNTNENVTTFLQLYLNLYFRQLFMHLDVLIINSGVLQDMHNFKKLHF